MNQSELVVDLLRYEVHKLGVFRFIELPGAFELYEYNSPVTPDNSPTVVLDNWFYNSFLIREQELNLSDEKLDAIYYTPARLASVRAAREVIKSRVRCALAKPGYLHHIGKVFGDYDEGYTKEIRLSRGAEIGGVVQINGDNYGIIESVGHNTFIFDRALATRVTHETVYRFGLLDAPIICTGVSFVVSPVRLISLANATGGKRVNIDFLCGVHVDPQFCNFISRTPVTA